jgi:RNA polymerase sigma factor (sigma-70 family)
LKLPMDLAESLFREHANYVFKIAFLLTKSQSMSDDITQETFIRIYENYHLYDQTKPINPWIYQVTLNVTRRIIRKTKWLSFVPVIPEKYSSNDIETSYFKDEEQKVIWKAINSLSTKYRELIILYFFQGFTLEQVGEILQIPYGTCKSRLHFIKKKLRKQLTSNEIFYTRGMNLDE